MFFRWPCSTMPVGGGRLLFNPSINVEKPYRVVYSSQSVSGVLAAVEAGVGIGLLGPLLASCRFVHCRWGPRSPTNTNVKACDGGQRITE